MLLVHFTPLMRGMTSHSTVIPPDGGGRFLIDWLCARFTYHDRAGWNHAIGEAMVKVNGRAVDVSFELKAGDVVSYKPETYPEPDVPRNAVIVYEDKDIIGVNKPAGLPSHPGGRYRNNTLWSILRVDYSEVQLLNRLDRETSGIMLATIGTSGAGYYRNLFQNGRPTKRYVVIVHGNPPDEIIARGWLSRDNSSAVRKKNRFTESFPDGARASECGTLFRTLARSEQFALLEARLETGRTHQIRATLYSLGYPVVGDKLYGLNEELFLRFADLQLTEADQQTLILPYQALHAAALSLRLKNGRDMTFYAALPEHLSDFVSHIFPGFDLSRHFGGNL